jgi:hypothetical protein
MLACGWCQGAPVIAYNLTMPPLVFNLRNLSSLRTFMRRVTLGVADIAGIVRASMIRVT